VSNNSHLCKTEDIIALIDGDLEPAARLAAEEHVKSCESCASELQAQRQFMCELDSVLASPFELTVPNDFARVVAVRAESDMRGVRQRDEHKRALRFCIILGLVAFALLGVTSSKALIFSAQSIAAKTVGVLELLAKATYDVASGFTIISRMLGGGLVADSRVGGLTALVLVALAVGLLSLLISRYHRARLTE
jgi:hypothetical protein